MANLLEITGEDIGRLADADLRDLVGLLCEADYRLAELSTKGITWGGHQDARDGGLDVVVRNDIGPPVNSFIPRRNTGFQVKKPDMNRAKIISEIRPNDNLREEINTLIQNSGAYIIVSSSGSTSNTALKARINAMEEAVADGADYQNLHLDFFDRGRVATWVRNHPSLILWVRNKIGRQLAGWHPYDNWAKAPGGIEEEYLIDDGLRLHDGTQVKNKEMNIADGLQKLRADLSIPGISVRLTGLSGVGKTRLVQALFDERVGEQALNRSQAFYADMSNSPIPDPVTFAEQLIGEKSRAILIIDNCHPDLHNRLTKICSESKSTVSLLTVEYDVREDLPEETRVFRLEPASEEIIEKLVLKRFSHIGQVDARTIANFSGGNARMAISLANTVKRGETLSGFQDEQLFERLFQQRHESDKKLLISAEVCSLVYSFEGTDTDSEMSELKILANLADKKSSELYRDVGELKERDLVQSRGVWRAVLPQAIANRLAKLALEFIPKDTIIRAFFQSGSERLIKSCTRRLNYLHDCEPAVKIVSEWLAPDGWIGKENCNFSSFGMDVFRNIAPVSPEKTLEAIERAANGAEGSQFTSRENSHYYEFVKILGHLAYDPKLFERSIELLCRFALSEGAGENRNSIRSVLKSFFYIYLSGTHATVEARAKIIEGLLDSEDQNKQELGIFLLDAALEAMHFSPSFNEFNFGARPRDFGYWPKTREEIVQWYEIFIGICTRIALSDQPISLRDRKIFADSFRGLWATDCLFDVLEISAKQIQQKKAWNEGWIAVRQIIRYDSKGFEEKVRERIHRIENLLRPNDLLERARTFALTDDLYSFDLEEDLENEGESSTGEERVQKVTRLIGSQVAQDNRILNILLPEIVSKFSMRLQSFGMGLADGCEDKGKLWKILRDQYEKTPLEERQISVFLGFLSSCAESDPIFYNSTLDNLLDDDLFGELAPIFQVSSTIDERGVERLHKAIDNGRAKIVTFQHLAWGRVHESITDDGLSGLLEKLISKEGGIDVAIEILKMRFFKFEGKTSEFSKSLIKIARHILSIYPLSKERERYNKPDYDLAQIARVCLKDADGSEAAEEFCQHLAQAIAENHIHAFDYNELLNVLARYQPFVFLDKFLGNNCFEEYQRRRMFDLERHGNPLNQIKDDDLIAWCEKSQRDRYPIVASAIQAFFDSNEEKTLRWKPIVYSILKRAPELSGILEDLAYGIRPTSWSGSLADILSERSILFESLFQHNNTEVRAWAKRQHSELQESIKRVRESEESRNCDRNESFE